MPVLDCPIHKKDWIHEVSLRNGVARIPAEEPFVENVEDAGPWESVVRRILGFRHLANDWDGFGAEAPSRELLESAVGLAYCFSEKSVAPPDRIAPGVCGSVIFEWQDPDGTYTELEIDRPLHAEVMVIEPGKSAKHWTIPTE